MVKKLNALDRSFLAGESRESMMHVGALMPFSPPPDQQGRAREFHRELLEELRRDRDSVIESPWNLKLRHPELLTSPLQAWVEDKRFDLEYHVRRSALPWPGDERELGVLVSRLHSHSIDFHRPPWETHFIEGLEGDRFAIYFKVHHAFIDGFTGIRMLTRSLSTDADERDTPMFFSRPPLAGKKDDLAPTLDSFLAALREQVGAARGIGKAIMNVARARRAHDDLLVAPMQAPKSILNQRITRNRRFATQTYPVERLKDVAKRAGGTLNDVVLALCASALRRFLIDQSALPDDPLTAMLPVNVRPKDDPGGGNAVGAILATLATDVADPRKRLDTIIQSTMRAKQQLQGMSKNAIMQYGALLMAPLLLSAMPSVVSKTRPAFNVVISNVPGPEKPLYFRGWRLEATYPLSIPFHGYALNITVQSYAGTLNFGFIGCRDALPHLQRIAVYSGEALAELERALGG